MPMVLDTSVAAAWALSETNHPLIEFSLLHFRNDSAIVPALFWFEMRNTLIVNERRARITEAGTAAFLESISKAAILVDHAPSEADVLALARKHRLTVYDAAYLELAARRDIPLATLDTKLEMAAKAEKIALFTA
jgi:predicted nucleic acid-binding protein